MVSKVVDDELLIGWTEPKTRRKLKIHLSPPLHSKLRGEEYAIKEGAES